MRYFVMALVCLFLVGCTDAGCARVTAYGSHHKVKLYSGEKLVEEWESSGIVQEDESGAGYFFVDSKTKKFIRVQGTVVVETAD